MIIKDEKYLRQVSKQVHLSDKDYKKAIKQIKDDLFKSPSGVGLSAIQVGYPIKIFGLKIKRKGFRPYVDIFINPRIINFSGEYNCNEGCLSFPGKFHFVKRFNYIHIAYIDEYDKQRQKEFIGFDACCVQHEIDHFAGVLFFDY